MPPIFPGVCNINADFESRRTNYNTEWMLDSASLSNALSQLSLRPTIDLFASRLNAQFSRYVSFKPDLGAVATDAFSLNLSCETCYAFPPLSVTNLFLKRVREDQASGILVLPNWPTQSWFPVAQNSQSKGVNKTIPVGVGVSVLSFLSCDHTI